MDCSNVGKETDEKIKHITSKRFTFLLYNGRVQLANYIRGE